MRESPLGVRDEAHTLCGKLTHHIYGLRVSCHKCSCIGMVARCGKQGGCVTGGEARPAATA